jgi:HK97 family phage prohead protease
MINKVMTSEVKTVDEKQGLVEAFTNSMGIVDKDGDVIDPVAFNSSIAKNLPIPVLAGHDQSQIVGKVLSARPVHIEEDEYRLYTLMQMNLETQAGSEAFSNVKGGFSREWSVGFNVPDDGWEFNGKGKEQVRRIKELDWVEVSTVIRGASPATQTISAKSEDEPKTLLEVYTGEKPEPVASDTVEETASDAQRVKAELDLLNLEIKINDYKKRKPKK